jgi:hypothetical protein
MALRTHNLPSERKKKTGEIDEAIFQVVKSNVKTFSASSPFKRAIWTMSISDVLGRRIALRNHNLPSGRLKNDNDEVDEAMFQGVDGPCELIFLIRESKKMTFVKSLKLCFK